MAKKKKNTWLIATLVVIILALVTFAVIKAKKRPKGEEVDTELVQLRTMMKNLNFLISPVARSCARANG